MPVSIIGTPLLPNAIPESSLPEIEKSTANTTTSVDLPSEVEKLDLAITYPKPAHSLSGKLASLVRYNENTVTQNLTLLESKFKDRMVSFQKLMRECNEKAAKLANAEERDQTLRTIQNWLSNIVCGASSVLGYCLTANPDPMYKALGYLLTMCGGSELVNQLMSQTGAWETIASQFTESEEDAQKLAQNMELSLSIVTKVIFFGISTYAYSQGVMANFDAVNALNMAASLAKSLLMLAQVYSSKKTSDAQEESAVTIAKHIKQKDKISGISSGIKKTLEALRKSIQNTADMMAKQEQMLHKQIL